MSADNGAASSLPDVVTEPSVTLKGSLGEVTLSGVGLWVGVMLVGSVVFG